MDDINKEKIYNRAFSLKEEGKLSESLELYNNLYDILIKESTEYACSFEGSEINKGETRKIMPQFFKKADEYLKKDNWACLVLNNIGVIFAETGDKKSAKKYFEESIKYTPEGLDYQNPIIGLEELEK